jgi:hypothetical protein
MFSQANTAKYASTDKAKIRFCIRRAIYKFKQKNPEPAPSRPVIHLFPGLLRWPPSTAYRAHPFYFDDAVHEKIGASPEAYAAVRDELRNIHEQHRNRPIFSNNKITAKIFRCIHPDKLARYSTHLREHVLKILNYYTRRINSFRSYIRMHDRLRNMELNDMELDDMYDTILYNDIRYEDVPYMIQEMGK